MPELWGADSQGNDVFLLTLKNANGMEVVISNYGAIIKSILVPSKAFGLIDTVLGFPRLEQYLKDDQFIGAICGRYCNRIQNGSLVLNGATFPLDQNNGQHTLHGGGIGFYKRTWEIVEKSQNTLILKISSDDGDQGFPGAVEVTASYTLDDSNALTFSWSAESNKPTVVSLTNHSYFNLAGFGDVYSHDLSINCRYYTPLESEGIPAGNIEPVNNSAFDFSQSKVLGSILKELGSAFELAGGLDHNWTHDKPRLTGSIGTTLNESCSDGANAEHSSGVVIRPMAQLSCEDSGLRLTVKSSLPSLQVYSGNNLARSGVFGCHEGICLESQFSPNSPNVSAFSSPILNIGEKMHHETVFQYEQL